LSPIWINIVMAIGAFSVADLSLYFGYQLFLAGATGRFKFSASPAGLDLAPGIGFALFGVIVAVYAIWHLVASSC
jgi:hypothetical protein